MGRRATPTAEKLRRGITAPSDVNYNEPMPRGGAPAMPEDMSKEAKEVWRHVMREQQRGVILAADRDVLRAYCEATARYRRSAVSYATSGPVLRGRRDGLVANPLHRITRDEAELMLRLARELGLSPSARASIRVNQENQPDLPDIGQPPRLRALPPADPPADA